MTAQEQPHAANEDILFLAEQASARSTGRSDVSPARDDKTHEAMFILLSRLSRSFDHERDRERAELLASVRRA
jgi:hypothetical protein